MKTFFSLLGNSTLSLISNIASKAINTIAFILIARLSGPSGVNQSGIFSLGTTYLVIFTATTWGLDELMIRQVAWNRRAKNQYFGSFLFLRFILICLAYGLFYVFISHVMPYGQDTRVPLLILGISFLPDSLGNVGQALLASFERFDIPVIAGIASSLVKLAGTIYVLSNSLGLVGIGWVWLAGSTLAAAINLGAAVHLASPLQPGEWVKQSFWLENLKPAVPFLVIGFLLTLEFQTDVVILSAIHTETVVAWYGAVTTIVFALTMIAQAFRAAVYPLMARFQKNNPEKLGDLYDLSIFYLGALSLPMAAGLTILSPQIIHLLYDSGFQGAVIPLELISWYLVLNFLNVPNSRIMLVQEKQKRLTLFLIGSMSLNIILNLILDPTWGASGAAAARVLSASFFFIQNYIYVSQHVHKHNLVRTLFKPVLATLVMAAGVWAAREINLWLAIFTGILLYLLTLYLIRGLSPAEQQWLAYLRGKLQSRLARQG